MQEVYTNLYCRTRKNMHPKFHFKPWLTFDGFAIRNSLTFVKDKISQFKLGFEKFDIEDLFCNVSLGDAIKTRFSNLLSNNSRIASLTKDEACNFLLIVSQASFS